MIYAVITGRCGNQLFTYYFLKKLLKLYNNDGITICDKILISQSDSDRSFRVVLGDFVSDAFVISHDIGNPVLEKGTPLQRLVYRLFLNGLEKYSDDRISKQRYEEKYQAILNFFGIYCTSQGYFKIRKSGYKNKFVYGNYENAKWFEEDKDLFRACIVPVHPSMENNFFYQKIVSTESVCVAIRRGDFLNKENSSLRSVCSEEYYRSAIKLMREKKPNAVFFFFSDEIEWVKNNYDFGCESYYESGNTDESTTLFLMSSCKNFIISNSTFNWWAQYLSNNKDKVVISPDHWFNLEGYNHPLIQKEWILIKC